MIKSIDASTRGGIKSDIKPSIEYWIKPHTGFVLLQSILAPVIRTTPDSTSVLVSTLALCGALQRVPRVPLSMIL